MSDLRSLALPPKTAAQPRLPEDYKGPIERHREFDNRTYGPRNGGFAPAAAFDVIDLDPKKTAAVASSIKALDALLTSAAADRTQRGVIREHARGIDGMVRFPEGDTMPWRADRPAIALYQTFSEDDRLSPQIRAAALHAENAITATVLKHRESSDFAPFNDADYSNAYGPTVHFPVSHSQVDTWAKNGISETDNAFHNPSERPISRIVA